MSFRRILIAVEGDDLGARAADLGFELARTLGAEIALVHAIGPAISLQGESGAVVIEEDARRLLAELAARTPGVVAAQFVPFGERAEEIVKTAREWSADLIVVGTRARGVVARTLLGSVADAVVRHAPCPVLVVPAPS